MQYKSKIVKTIITTSSIFLFTGCDFSEDIQVIDDINPIINDSQFVVTGKKDINTKVFNITLVDEDGNKAFKSEKIKNKDNDKLTWEYSLYKDNKKLSNDRYE